jgi:hypothetical protein
MDVHKPRAAHSWREFLTEVGMIVVGVLIALTAEQLVLRWETAHRIHLAEMQVRVELGADDGPQAAERDALGPCVAGSLERIRTAAESGASRADVLAATGAYDLPHPTWDDNAYRGALASGLAAQMNHATYESWARAYAVIPSLDREDERETHDAADLRAISRTGGPITPEERTQILRAVATLAVDNQQIIGRARWLLDGMARAGVKLDPTRAADIVGDALIRPMAAACIADLRSRIH